MDPITHYLITRKYVGKENQTVLAGLAPDIPFYLFYPYQVIRAGKLFEAIQNDCWPSPPAWLKTLHHAFHSLPLATGVILFRRFMLKKSIDQKYVAWILHILIDIPTHSRQKWAPQFLWPFSSLTIDGTSWTDYIFPLLRKVIPRRNYERSN